MAKRYRYQVGDRVVLLKDHPDNNEILFAGMMGQVCRADDGENHRWISVCWDEWVGGHSCSCACEEGYGWEVPREQLRLWELPEVEDASIAGLAEIFSLIGIGGMQP